VKVGQNPIGIAINSTGTRIYTANRATRDLSVVDPAALTEVARVSSTALPTDPVQNSIRKGMRFFNTSAARWSAEGWGSCSGCHPDGYTDAVTWHFAAGPRQSLGLEAIYNKSNLSDHRILNWTGIFDEVHDFELNTRGVSGGLGAIVQDANNDGVEEQINLAAVDTNGDGIVENQQGLNGSTDLVNDTVSLNKDWNDIDKFIQVLRPANASRQLDAAAVARGRQVFIDNKCQNCHGGAKWSISRRSYAPSVANSTALKLTNVIATALLNPDHNQNTLVLETEEAGFCKDLDGNPANGAETCGSPLNILRITCVLRDVDTFGVFDPETGVTDKRMEVAANMVAQAQGLMGYNPPGLFNLSLSGPYLHHGQAETLDDLFTDRFASHHQSNSPTFLDNLDNAAQQGQKADLIQFLLSIDASTAPINPDAGQDICPNL
jgi:mono/diheme cytochrome c family protein